MNKVKSVGGPGSMKIDVEIDLEQLRNKLLQVGHPVGSMPQWNGDKIWLVIADPTHTEAQKADERARLDLPSVLVIKAKTKDRAEQVAQANLKRRDGPTWTVEATEVKFGSPQMLLMKPVPQ